jgi:Fanconi-associated nuclease 1
MLKGRESLVRLVGRRRRSPLPASLAAALLCSPAPTHQVKTLNPKPLLPMSFALHDAYRFLHFPQADDAVAGAGAGASEAADAGPSSGGGPGAERVACPVCGESVRGSDYSVNTHLGPYPRSPLLV